MSTIHPKKEKLIYKCTKSKDCKKVFSQRYRLTIHEKSHLLESQIKDRPMAEDILTDCPSNQYLFALRRIYWGPLFPDPSAKETYSPNQYLFRLRRIY